MNRRLVLVLISFIVVPVFAYAASKGREITWDDLAAPIPPEIEEQMDVFFYSNPPDGLSEEEWQMEFEKIQKQAYPVVQNMDGEVIRIPGYVVPIDLEANSVREFLLVPYLGACIHVPPPPPNQVIYVKSKEDYEIDDLFDPVWVTGKIRIGSTSTDLAEASYILNADEVIRYVSD